jgi:hypothetical protein
LCHNDLDVASDLDLAAYLDLAADLDLIVLITLSNQVVMLESAQAMLNASDGPSSLRINLLPSGLFAGLNVEKNRLGQPLSWRWGDLVSMSLNTFFFVTDAAAK